MISLVRVDNRLIHGQVVEAWLPFLKVRRVVVADDEASTSPLIRAAMGLAVSGNIDVQILGLGEVDFAGLSADPVPTLVLIRDVDGVVAAKQRGLDVAQVNLGNVHFASGRTQVSPSVFLSPHELSLLKMLSESGSRVDARAVPTERPVYTPEMQQRLGRGS